MYSSVLSSMYLIINILSLGNRLSQTIITFTWAIQMFRYMLVDDLRYDFQVVTSRIGIKVWL